MLWVNPFSAMKVELRDCIKPCEHLRGKMRVVLRHAEIDRYYARRKHWVSNPGSALGLKTIKRATIVSRDESFGEMEIVLTYDDPSCELVLPLRCERKTDDQARRDAA
jgi:hypothetical protein